MIYYLSPRERCSRSISFLNPWEGGGEGRRSREIKQLDNNSICVVLGQR
jgi:hypothetical protein